MIGQSSDDDERKTNHENDSSAASKHTSSNIFFGFGVATDFFLLLIVDKDAWPPVVSWFMVDMALHCGCPPISNIVIKSFKNQIQKLHMIGFPVSTGQDDIKFF